MANPIVTDSSTQVNGASLVLGFKTTLTDAQMKALPTTPITLVAAPSSGYRIKVVSASAHLVIVGGYTNINTEYCPVQISYLGALGDWACAPVTLNVNDGSLATPITRTTDYFGSANNLTVDMPPNAQPIDAGAKSGVGEWFYQQNALTAADQNGVALVISTDNNGSGNWTGGNASNSLVVTVYIAYEAL